MSSRNLQGRGKEGGRGGGPPETTSAGRGGGRFNRTTGRFAMPRTSTLHDRIPSTTPGAEPPRDARDSGSARSHSTHLETRSSNRP